MLRSNQLSYPDIEPRARDRQYTANRLFFVDPPRYNTAMLKGRVMAASSVILSLAAIFFVYGFGALVIRGDWKMFGITVGVLAVCIVVQVVVAIWNETW